MKKTALLVACILLISFCPVKADVIDDIIDSLYVPGFHGTVAHVTESGEVLPESNLQMRVTFGENGTVRRYNKFYNITKEAFENLDNQTKDIILSELQDNEHICLMYFARNEDDVYPDFEIMNVRINTPFVSGGRTELFGKDYRLYCLENKELIQMPITEENDEEISFDTDTLGMYILYYNVNVYSVDFYTEYSQDKNDAFYVADNLGSNDIVPFPAIPTKDGYVFTGWKHEYWKGMYSTHFYIEPFCTTAFGLWSVYASWCPEEEYTPLEVIIDSDKITKGKEDGTEITLTLSEGRFDDVIDEDIENKWKIVGNNDLSIASVERIDDTTAKLTLSGNSTNKYTEGEIQVEFDSSLYISHGDYVNFEAHETADIQLDENGIKKKMFISDNSLTLEKQKRSNGTSITRYTVTFESNGGKEIKNQRVKENDTITPPENPLKEDHIFAGWYTDSNLTEKYDFESPVTEDFTLYAAWNKDEKRTILLTVGKKEAIVFEKVVACDVAPVIKNNRVMLPIRIVAENLGAKVTWSMDKPDEVKITKDNTEIIIYINKDYAFVNNEKVALDSPAFLENDRTYLPLRFVAESLDAKVEWNDITKEIIITP